jgi:hypothetical protein
MRQYEGLERTRMLHNWNRRAEKAEMDRLTYTSKMMSSKPACRSFGDKHSTATIYTCHDGYNPDSCCRTTSVPQGGKRPNPSRYPIPVDTMHIDLFAKSWLHLALQLPQESPPQSRLPSIRHGQSSYLRLRPLYSSAHFPSNSSAGNRTFRWNCHMPAMLVYPVLGPCFQVAHLHP